MGEAVLCVANYSPDEGYAWWLMENFWVGLAEAARSEGMLPLLVYPATGALPRSIEDAEIEVLWQPFPGNGLVGIWNSMRLVWRRRIRLVYLTDRSYTSLKYAFLRLAGVRVFVNHDHTPGDRPPIRGVKGVLKAIVRRLPVINCDVQLCVSPLIQQRALANARIPARQTAVVQNGIEPIRCKGEGDYCRTAFGIPPETLICISVGRAHPYKRVDFLIEVARKCVYGHGRDDIVFVHCGDGPDLGRLKTLARSAGVEDSFIFAGRRDDVPQLLCSSDLAIHAAKGEAFSLAVLEYLSAGLPTLLPDVPSVSQAVEDGFSGILYKDEDSADAAEKLLELADDQADRHRIGATASRLVEERYSMTQMNDQFRRALVPFLQKARGVTVTSHPPA